MAAKVEPRQNHAQLVKKSTDEFRRQTCNRPVKIMQNICVCISLDIILVERGERVRISAKSCNIMSVIAECEIISSKVRSRKWKKSIVKHVSSQNDGSGHVRLIESVASNSPRGENEPAARYQKSSSIVHARMSTRSRAKSWSQ